jgi:RNA 2',3'-cyclic 3'-phosphodiesterase
MEEEQKRLFFGLEVNAPWPSKLPPGRHLDEKHRHLTLAFLGQVPYSKLTDSLKQFPTPSFKVGLVGRFDQCLLLPKKHPHVIAWNIEWLENPEALLTFQENLCSWLNKEGFPVANSDRKWLAHVTLSRQPFPAPQWLKTFNPLPLTIKDIHLYESLGNLHYSPIWTHPLKAPFIEIEHMADLAFHVYGESLEQLYCHAKMALAFRDSSILSCPFIPTKLDSVEDIVIALNEIIRQLDREEGSPFKAVSFHGDITKNSDETLKWEMIVDV